MSLLFVLFVLFVVYRILVVVGKLISDAIISAFDSGIKFKIDNDKFVFDDME